jgi:hypothetical protein
VEGEIDAMLKFLSTYGFQKPAKSHGLKRIPATGMPDCLPIGPHRLAALAIRLYIDRRPLPSTGIP